MFWLILTVPFSEWKGGSLVTVMGYGELHSFSCL
jgi:hypothetical protein